MQAWWATLGFNRWILIPEEWELLGGFRQGEARVGFAFQRICSGCGGIIGSGGGRWGAKSGRRRQ